MKETYASSKNNSISFGCARFQWMSPALIRLQWNAQKQFEDRPSLSVINREFAAVDYRVEERAGWLILSSAELTLKYRDDGRDFHSGNLSITFDCAGKKRRWKPGMCAEANLGGTARTLDEVDGCMQKKTIANPLYRKGAPGEEGRAELEVSVELDLGEGLISRSGWSLYDDSKNVVLNSCKDGKWQSWVEARSDAAGSDLYFFGYGHNYKAAIRDGAQLFGSQPLPPRYAFGYWWSRYWAYSDKEIDSLLNSFDAMGVPIDVMVIDMDWHLPGWTGYTWDPNYFPDPDEFLRDLKARGVKASLNLHPADGVAKHEAQFVPMANAMGVNPTKADRVPFDITDPEYMRHYFEILHHPEEKRGIDFWWMDWQQGQSTAMAGLDTLPWINHLHWVDMEASAARTKKRPLIFSRYGGLGAGRYCIGFSGDTYSNWDSLRYQPYFTATAANVLYGYWSHDIGGHMPGEIEPELYTRWMQFGLYSPILRTHTTKNAAAERRFWQYPAPYSEIMMDVVRRRYELTPYIYSESRHTYETGLSLVRPMYYEHSESSDAYRAKDQYYFGSEMLVAPVLNPCDATGELAAVKLWLPENEEGFWFDIARGIKERSGQWITRNYLLSEVPVFVKPGAVIPGQKKVSRLNAKSIAELSLDIYPGECGSYELYEDDGQSTGYTKKAFTRLHCSHETRGGKKYIRVAPVEGGYRGYSARKKIEISLHGEAPPAAVVVDGVELPWSYREQKNSWRYDGDAATTHISIESVDTRVGLEVVVALNKSCSVDGLRGVMARLERVVYYNNVLTTHIMVDEDERIGIELYQCGNRLSRQPENVAAELQRLRKRLQDAPQVLRAMGKHPINAHQKERAQTALRILKEISL